MKVGDLVTHDRSHLPKDHPLYDTALRSGIIINIGIMRENERWIAVMWSDLEVTYENVRSVEIIHEAG